MLLPDDPRVEELQRAVAYLAKRVIGEEITLSAVAERQSGDVGGIEHLVEAVTAMAEQMRHLTQKVWEIEQHMATLAPMRHEHDVEAHIVNGKIVIGPPRAVA